ncbi:MAG TPA: carbamoyltransferase HypF [Gemmatimonadales bacterium]|nr:carbamoyltransferase HypF [Gemmatimonadales bacterium]
MTAAGALPAEAAMRLRITGVVQGVGFRPFVHRLALRHALTGWVRNSAGDVRIEVEGGAAAIDAFVRELAEQAPPLARIERIQTRRRGPAGRRRFEILGSAEELDRSPPVPADVAMCAACEAELFDPADRRYRYPFITCTDCGPRFSVIRAMPFDRERTTMREFAQCAACAREYRSPGDRRYHSETNSCPACGPSLWFSTGRPAVPVARDGGALESAAAALVAGGIVALRGLGGFHLAVDATSEAAVLRMRERKGREAKPLAVMLRTLDDALAFCQPTAAETRLLTAIDRPIVLVPPRPGAPFAPSIAPGLAHVGIFLAYTPLHHLLLDLVRRPLVMTSGNRSDEPLAYTNADALARLGDIADGFLLHDREIVSPVDDSVARCAGSHPVLLRRARGLAPLPLPLPVATPRPLVAVGPHFKATFTLAAGDRAFVGPHVGDLESLETLTRYRVLLDRCRRLFRVEPEVAVRDLHPGYLSTRIAEELGLARVIPVQHHHAHIAAVLAEHGEGGVVVGLGFDGTGYGDDGSIWGGEVLLADLCGYRRIGHLRPAPLPGGDAAARAPWRAAAGYCALEPTAAPALALAFEGVPAATREIVERQIARGLNTPAASSMGRLFDAAAAVLGVRQLSRYEGEAAMALEALAGARPGASLPFPLRDDPGGGFLLDPLPLLEALGAARRTGRPAEELAAGFHDALARAAVDAAARGCDLGGVATVALGGGVFQNARLVTSVIAGLEARGLRVLVPRTLSPNDGAVSFGQAAVAAALLAAGR